MGMPITWRLVFLAALTHCCLIDTAVAQSLNGNALGNIIEFLRRGQHQMDLESLDERNQLLPEYDFIVVGAGTAGCALAARLSENPNWKVLLLEAGGSESYVMDIPIAAHFLQLGEMNWKYRTEPSSSYCLAMKDNRCNWPRGKVMGGSSVLNYMMYTRGNRLDYDHWAALGNPGWSYEELLPYFRKYEGSLVPDADTGHSHPGVRGPVKISYNTDPTRVADAFVRASEQAGLPRGDYNGESQMRVSYLQANIANATRWSSNRAYLYPIKGKRTNLHIKKKSLVTRVLIDPQSRNAYGVMLLADGRMQKVLARKEVIVSAGAINTPQLLMLSGVGPAKHLRKMGIKPLADLAVGYNLQDHTAPAVTFTTNTTTLTLNDLLNTDAIGNFLRGRGPILIPGGVEAISFYALDEAERQRGWPDMEIFACSNSWPINPALPLAFGIKPSIYETMFGELERRNGNSFLVFPMILRARSRGRIKLQSRNPQQHPLIYPNYFHDPYDLNITIRGLKQCNHLSEMPAFRAINARLLDKQPPACRRHKWLSDEFWECYARHFTLTIYHYSGTAKMGPRSDPSAVVDARLRVHGIGQLRVVDASIMPYLIAGHPNGPVYLIAEKAADMIKQDHNYNS
ncbi:glucose dehydrogenase [FAD, quinone]-like [Drosophila sulfurigaster albostrigata]|uniref:glucose dehydrogenase [FAD, quinone]-like n=1 Tax=Drosophila sulfurigaster albostrigata TaxID=89887 RepID=UPI002D219136|nr:glucose dehydrogenase [FAD, quinone]-like [Drosophila sulfurigaster albostrigata]